MSYICGITFSKWVIQSAAAAIDSEPPEDFYVWSGSGSGISIYIRFQNAHLCFFKIIYYLIFFFNFIEVMMIRTRNF